MNTLRTILLMGVLTALIVLIGGFLCRNTGMYMAFGFALLPNLGSCCFSDQVAPAMSGAQPNAQPQAPEPFNLGESLAARAAIPVPRISLIASPSPNAFATGRDPQHSAVAVTA